MMNSTVSLVVTQTWQLALLILVVWSILRLFGKNRPHLAHGLWLLVLIKCVTPPIWSSPTSPFSWMGATQISHSDASIDKELPVVAQPSSLSSTDLNSNSESIVVRVRPIPKDEWQKSERTTKETASQTPATQSADNALAPVSKQSSRFEWQTLLLGLWVLGSCLAAFVAATRYSWFRWKISREPSLSTHTLEEATQVLAKKLGLRRRVRLLIRESSVGPAVLGLFRPTILLPRCVVHGKSLAELEPLIAHELVHIRRGDLWWALLQIVVRSLYWFHPMVWYATRKLALEAERSCDEETVASLKCSPAAYARGLVDVLEKKHRLHVAPALPGVRPVDITAARLERVMRIGQGGHRRTPIWVWGIMFGLGLVALPGAAIVVGQQEQVPTRLPQPSGEVLPQPLATHPNLPRVDEDLDWTVQTYEVAELLESVKSFNPTVAEQTLTAFLGVKFPGPNGASATPDGRQVQLATKHGIIELGYDAPTMTVRGTTLFVFADKEGHKAVKHNIARFEEYGFSQVLVRTKFVTCTLEQMKELGIKWSVASANAEQLSINIDNPNENGLAQDDVGEISGGVSARSVVEKNAPILYSVLDDKQVSKTLAQLRQDARTNVLMAPSVTMFNGQQASIIDAVSRPFVTELHRVRDSNGNLTDVLQPTVKVIHEGSVLNVTAYIEDDQVMRLDSRLSYSEILNVETADLPIGSDDAPATIQIPEVATTEIESSLSMPSGQTLALNCMIDTESDGPQAFIVLLTCSTPERIMQASQPTEADTQVTESEPESRIGNRLPPALGSLERMPEDLPARHAVIEASAWEPTGSSEARSEQSQVRIRSTQPIDQPQRLKPLVGALNAIGLNIVVDGNVEYEMDGEGIRIFGSSLSLESLSDESPFAISGAHGQIVISHEGHVEMGFEGEVLSRIDGFQISAAELISDGDTVKAEGDVELRADEIHLTGQSLVINQQDKVITVEGAARLVHRPKDGAESRVSARRIVWHPATNQIEVQAAESVKIDN